MKLPVLFAFAFSCLTFAISAQTFVPAGFVTGPWTAAGSPYIVQGDITCGNLTIQAGVDVRFQNHSGLTVYGSLKTYGTAAAPVIFESDDTTGWYNINNGTGGTKGIYIYGNGTDTTILDHFIFKDAKCAINDTWGMGIASNTGLFILRNSEVYHNFVSGTSYVISVNGGSPIIENNYIHDNWGRGTGGVALWDSQGLIQNNEFARNRGNEGGAVYAVNNTSSQGPLIVNNNFHHNRADFDGGAIYIATGMARIRNNTIAFNHSLRAGSGIYDLYARVEIVSNLICNNSDSTNNPCGINDGGGGILINSQGDTAFIQNNIIANNSCYFSGGGVRVTGSSIAVIENNNIVNNSCTHGYFTGGLDFANNSRGTIRNNILWGNRGYSSFGQVDSVQVYIGANDTLTIEYNYGETSFMGTLLINANSQVNGNQSSNVLVYSANPGFVSSTSGDGVAFDATVADWHLMWGSLCINAGTVSFLDLTPQPVDFYGDARISGGLIDIGAVEYPMENGIEENRIVDARVYPNPASDFLRIENCGAGSLVTIMDVTGHTVSSELYDGERLEISSLSTGVYFISFEDESGNFRQGKFVKF